MKRFLACVLIIFVLLNCFGCGEKQFPILSTDEYYIYEKGVLLNEITDIENGEYIFVKSYTEPSNNFLETKRGIRVGSLAEDVAIKYEGFPCSINYIFDEEFFSSYKIFYDDKDRLYKGIKKALDLDYPTQPHIIKYLTHYIDGEYVDSVAFTKHLEENGISPVSTGMNPLEVEGVKTYLLAIEIENGIVKNILVKLY